MIDLPQAPIWRAWGRARPLSLALILAVPHAHAASASHRHLGHRNDHALVSQIMSGAAGTVRASYYGVESGTRTASGAIFHPMGFTAAHRTLPFGTHLRVCYRACVIVVINDRGPAKWTGRALDLSKGAARATGLESVGVAFVEVARID